MTPDDVPDVRPVPPAQPPWPPTALPARRPPRRTVAVLAAVAVVAIGFAIAGWLRPTKPAPAPTTSTTPTYTDEQIADAKAHVCATYDKVHQAVLVNTGRSGGGDPTAQLAVTANARMALFDGGEYLLTKLAEEPATPPDLAKAIRDLVSAYQQLAIDYMAEVPDSQKESSFNAVDKPNTTVYEICK